MNRILIIEDDDLISTVYARKYLDAGFEIAVAADGAAGLELAASFKPDLIHLDLNVPKVNGVEIIKRLRSQAELEALPIILLSNTYQNRLVKAAMSAGARRASPRRRARARMMIEIVGKHLARMSRPLGEPQAVAIAIPPAPDSAVPLAAATAVPESPGSPKESGATDSPYTIQLHRHAAFQAEIQRGFLAPPPEKLMGLRERVAPLFRVDDAARVAGLSELYRATNSFAGQAGVAGFQQLSQMSCAIAALLRELIESPAALTPSAVQTIVGASDFLALLLERATDPTTEAAAPAIVLVIDDDVITRRAEGLALSRLNLATVSVDDPRVALRLLAENRFSLIFLDIEMPGMNGFDLCRELRALPGHQATPVVFVSSLADGETRKQAAASGGNDLLAKPFLPMELAVKALTLLR